VVGKGEGEAGRREKKGEEDLLPSGETPTLEPVEEAVHECPGRRVMRQRKEGRKGRRSWARVVRYHVADRLKAGG
jgi:hypothetical protein